MSRHTHRIPTPYHVPPGGQESKRYVDFSQENDIGWPNQPGQKKKMDKTMLNSKERGN